MTEVDGKEILASIAATFGSPSRDLSSANSDTKLDEGLIVLPGDDVTITETATKLFGIIAPQHKCFVRGGVVVTLVENQNGDLILEVLKPSFARSYFERFGKCVAWRSGARGDKVLKPVIIAEDMARALLDSHEAKALLPKINGLVNCPVLVEKNGKVEICGKGYDPITGLLITGGELPPEVGLEEAVLSLTELISEYDFQTPGDRSRAIAAMLTPAIKMGGHLQGCVPADVAEADRSQSGKTFRQKVEAAIYNEKVSIVTRKEGGVGSTDESLNIALIQGRPFIQFDNFRNKFDSQHIEAFLTAEKSFSVRGPYSKSIEVDPSRFFILLSSNGLETTRDFANRSSIIRIRKRDNFAYKQYPEGDLLAHIRAKQAYYLGCVFAVVRAWIGEGKLKTKETRHDFREWCQSLDWIVQIVFKAAPLMDGHAQAQERVSNPRLTFLRKLALVVEAQGKLDEQLIASQLYEIAEEEGIEIPGLKEWDKDKGSKQIGIVMAKLFEVPEVPVDRFKVTRIKEIIDRDDGKGTYESKSYVFTKVNNEH